MKEIENDIIKKYSYKNYVVYVKETKNSYDFYLQNEEYAVIDLMLGVDKEDYSMKEIEELIFMNIESHIKNYKESYEDELIF